MKDDFLRETLSRATTGEPGTGDAFARFQVKHRRAARMRGAVVAAGAVAAIVAMVTVLPGPFNSGEQTLVPGGGPLEPARSFLNRYQDPRVGFELRYPLEWVGRGSPGQSALFFPVATDERTPYTVADSEKRDRGCGDCAKSERDLVVERARRFYVEVRPLASPCGSEAVACLGEAFDRSVVGEMEAAGARVDEGETVIAGRRADRISYSFPAEPKTVARLSGPVLPRSWCSGCFVTEYVVAWYHGWTLDVRVVSPSEAALRANGADATLIVSSIARLVSPS